MAVSVAYLLTLAVPPGYAQAVCGADVTAAMKTGYVAASRKASLERLAGSHDGCAQDAYSFLKDYGAAVKDAGGKPDGGSRSDLVGQLDRIVDSLGGQSGDWLPYYFRGWGAPNRRLTVASDRRRQASVQKSEHELQDAFKTKSDQGVPASAASSGSRFFSGSLKFSPAKSWSDLSIAVPAIRSQYDRLAVPSEGQGLVKKYHAVGAVAFVAGAGIAAAALGGLVVATPAAAVAAGVLMVGGGLLYFAGRPAGHVFGSVSDALSNLRR